MASTFTYNISLKLPFEEQSRWMSRKTLNSPPLMSTPESQISAEQSSVKKTGTYQKDILHPKTRKKPQDDRRGTLLI